jgi:hypothetical protein
MDFQGTDFQTRCNPTFDFRFHHVQKKYGHRNSYPNKKFLFIFLLKKDVEAEPFYRWRCNLLNGSASTSFFY